MESYYLCLAQRPSQIVPIYLPGSTHVSEGDIVAFEWNGETVHADIRFTHLCAEVEDIDIWEAVAAATQTAPVQAIGLARMEPVTWTNADRNSVIDPITPPTDINCTASVEKIIDAVAQYFYLSPREITGLMVNRRIRSAGKARLRIRSIYDGICSDFCNIISDYLKRHADPSFPETSVTPFGSLFLQTCQ